MSESQPDMLGGKSVPASRLKRGRKTTYVRRNGWAGTPGEGPEGETCGSCQYCDARRFRKTYYKCSARAGDHWKGGRETDIRPLDPACEKWQPTIERAEAIKAEARKRENETVSEPDGNRAASRESDRQVSRASVTDRRHDADSGERDPQTDTRRPSVKRPASVNLIDGKEPVQYDLPI